MTEAGPDPAAALRRRERELEAALHRQEADLVRLRHQRGSEVADDEHDPEGTTLSAGWSLLAGVQHDTERELTAVRDALALHAQGRYGVCTGCGDPIDPDRLQVRPMATRCVACASRPR